MKISLFIIILGLCAPLVGCGPSKAERDAEMRARLEQQERDDRAAEAANKAITEMSKKLGRKPPALDLGVPQPAPVPAPEPKTSDQP